jgi:endonuclease I
VDDFVIKYVGREYAEHLMASIKNKFEISSDWTGSAYCGINIGWGYINGTVDLAMPGYIKAELQNYQLPTRVRAEHAPYTYNSLTYGAKTY